MGQQHAIKYLQVAIADAEDYLGNNPGDTVEIWVADGTYYPDMPGDTDDPDDTFSLLNGVELLGGFTGVDEADRNQRNWGANETILSGNIGTTSSYHVVSADDVGHTARLDGFTIKDGEASTNGGGAHLTDSAPLILNCKFTDNSGGAISVDGHYQTGPQYPRFQNCFISGNEAHLYGGGIYVIDAAIVYLTNCVIHDNSATFFGGGVYLQRSAIDARNCTVTSNSCNYEPGGGLYVLGTLSLWNCILWNNTDVDNDEDSQFFAAGGDFNIDYTCIQNLTGSYGTGNVSSDPDFENLSSGDLRLDVESPLINAGYSSIVPADTYDLDEDGNATEAVPDLEWTPRVVASDVDMGAFEFQCLGDIDADGDVDFDDFTALLANYGSCGDPCFSDCPADLDGDCEVEFDDFTALLANFGACDVSGVGLDDTLLELFLAAGLNQDDYDDYLDIMENGTQTEKDCWTAWLNHYLNCPSTCITPHLNCDDPFLTN